MIQNIHMSTSVTVWLHFSIFFPSPLHHKNYELIIVCENLRRKIRSSIYYSILSTFANVVSMDLSKLYFSEFITGIYQTLCSAIHIIEKMMNSLWSFSVCLSLYITFSVIEIRVYVKLIWLRYYFCYLPKMMFTCYFLSLLTLFSEYVQCSFNQEWFIFYQHCFLYT